MTRIRIGMNGRIGYHEVEKEMKVLTSLLLDLDFSLAFEMRDSISVVGEVGEGKSWIYRRDPLLATERGLHHFREGFRDPGAVEPWSRCDGLRSAAAPHDRLVIYKQVVQ